MSDLPPGAEEAISASRLGALLGDALPTADTVSPAALELAEVGRELLDALARTAVDDDERRRIIAVLRDATVALRAATHPTVVLVRHPDGRIENLTQAGAGRLNPRSVPIRFDPLPAPPPAGEVRPFELVGTFTLGESSGGGPGRAHGGVVATVLDEALGVAATAAGATGLTVALEVRFRAAAPLGVPLRVTARCTKVEGRKSFSTGELSAGDTLVAEATAVYVAQR